MSDEAKPAKPIEDALLGLTSLDFGPAWARGGGSAKKSDESEGTGKRQRDERGGEQRGDRRGDDRRDNRRDDRGGQGRRFDNRNKGGGERRGGQGGGRREDQGGGGRREGYGGGERREGQGGGRRFDHQGKGGRGRREDDRGRPDREETPPPVGFTASVMPVEDGLDGLAKEILAGGRTYSVFDLAKLVLGARDRFNVSFRADGDAKLYRCRKDGSLWLTKDEALRQFWNADWRSDFYEEVVSDTAPPTGNFQTVARCGFSGEWLGPPNYHGYQPAIAQLHRERFSNMSLDAYKRKIRMERGEEAVAAWLEKMSKRVKYRPTGGVVREAPVSESAPSAEGGAAAPAPGDQEGAADEVVAEEGLAPDEDATPAAETVADEPSAVEDGGDESPATEAEPDETDGEPEAGADGAGQAEAVPASSAGPLIDDLRGVERHFLENHFEDAFQVTNRAWVPGNIPGNNLSPGLLTLLRDAVAEERRYPGKLTPMLCRQLSGRHVAVFKWRRKLKAGPSRPHPVPEDVTIADRPKALLTWITENSGKKLQHLWKDLLPPDVTDEAKMGWYHDLHWLLNQGYVLLMADSSVHLAKLPGDDAPPAKAKSKRGRERRGASDAGKVPTANPAKPVPRAEPPSPPRPVAGAKASGLYALSGRTLSGMPKSPESLSGRGLWPQLQRIEAEEDEESETLETRW